MASSTVPTRVLALGKGERVVEAGIGEGLIAEAATFLGLECVRLSERYGPKISDVFPAYAVARLVESELAEIARN